jgi:hypothetical protein
VRVEAFGVRRSCLCCDVFGILEGSRPRQLTMQIAPSFGFGACDRRVRACICFSRRHRQMIPKRMARLRDFGRLRFDQQVCEVAPEQFHSTDEVRDALTKAQGEIINPQLLVRELLADLDVRRLRSKRPQRALLVLDESGQWIENSADRLSQLQALVEEAAVAGRGRLWLIVTTHGDMASIYQEARALEGDMKKIEGRFFMKPALTTENIELVLEERLFRKKVEASAAGYVR